jgi:hypothetical protein
MLRIEKALGIDTSVPLMPVEPTKVLDFVQNDQITLQCTDEISPVRMHALVQGARGVLRRGKPTGCSVSLRAESMEADGTGQSPDTAVDRTQAASDGPGSKRQSRRQRQRSAGNGELEDGEGGENGNATVQEELAGRPDAGDTAAVSSSKEVRSARRKKKTANAEVDGAGGGGEAGEGRDGAGEGSGPPEEAQPPVGDEEKKE